MSALIPMTRNWKWTEWELPEGVPEVPDVAVKEPPELVEG